MKKIAFLTLSTFLFFTSWSQQRKTIYISTSLPLKFRAFIDGELQYYGESATLKISNVPQGEKQLQVRILTPSNQFPSITIAKTSEKEEFYKIEQVGDSYVLRPNPNGSKVDKSFYARAFYIPKIKAYTKDTSVKKGISCQLSDSILNKFILDLGNLKDQKAKKEYTLNFMKRKCLYTHQIKSIGYRIDDDKLKMEMYQALFFPALDRKNFANLTSTFQSQLYGIKFADWFNAQKF